MGAWVVQALLSVCVLLVNAVTMADRFPPPEMKITRVGAPALLEFPCTRRTALRTQRFT